MADVLLALEGVEAGYGPIPVLKDVSLEVRAGEIVTLIGANGAGKTTTLMTISGIVKARKGTVRLAGEALNGVRADKIVKRGIAQVPEGRKIFPRLTVLENLQMGAFTRDDDDGIEEDLGRVYASFPILKERSEQLGGTLSGGEQQMLAIGRAMMVRPKVLLLDEPSLGLAPLFILKIFDIVRELNRAGTTVLLVE